MLKLHRPLGSCGICDTLGLTQFRLVTPRVYHIHHKFLGVLSITQVIDLLLFRSRVNTKDVALSSPVTLTLETAGSSSTDCHKVSLK